MSRNRGFTLIEVLLALSILAMVVTGIYAAFSTSSSNIEGAERARDEGDMARSLIARLSDDISNAFYKDGLAGAVFYGRSHEVETGGQALRKDSVFMTTLTNWRRPDTKETDLWEVGYLFQEKPDGSGHVMMRSEKREFSKDAQPMEGGTEFEITDKVDELRLRYYDGANWSDDWDAKSSHRLPKAVEITLVLAGGRLYGTKVEAGR